MPRFPDECGACLKRVMLSRAPQDFMFTHNDVDVICAETHLSQAQVQVWAEHFRMRYGTLKERLEFLQNESIDKESSVRLNRVAVNCFNVNPEFAANFKFLKTKGGGEFGIKFMLAAFNKEVESGEFFIEFEDKVWEHKLIESFRTQGASQVITTTFANNDGGESAANALVRITACHKKFGEGYTRGACTPALLAKLHAKMEEAERQENLQEFDEKTSAAIKFSLAEQTVKLEAIGNDVQSHAVKLESIEGGVQSHAVKLESQAEDIGNIRQSVCNVILDLQTEIKDLKDALAKSQTARDITEGKMGHKTRLINQQDAYIFKLEEEQKAWIHEKKELLRSKTALQEELDQIRKLQKILENAGQLAEILSSTLADERAAKRPRVTIKQEPI